MKKAKLALLLCVCLLLGGCTNKNEERFRSFSEELCGRGDLAVTAEVQRLVEDAPCRERMLADYAEIRRSLGGSGASRAVARAMIEELKEK